MRILVKDAVILTMDSENRVYDKGCIGIEGDSIYYIGEEKGFPEAWKPDKVIDAKGKMALPGFINTHTHVSMTLFRGYANDIPLWEWLSEKMWPLEDRMRAEDAYWLSLLSIMEMIAAGVTTFSDMYMFMDETARAVRDTGVRGVLARGLQGPDAKSDLRLEENKRLWEEWHGKAEGRIRVMVGPHAIYTCSPEYLERCMGLADELGVGIHIHLSETRREVEESLEKHGRTPVRVLQELGLFKRPVLAAHCVHLTEEDMDILKQFDVQVSHCPGSNLKLGSGFAPIVSMMQRGINVGLGTDSAASNNNLSIMKEMMLAALISKGLHEDPVQVTAIQALKMAAVNGAKALGWDREIGTLEVGKKADLILINMVKPHFHPKADPITHLVYSGYTGDVDTVLVNGRILLEASQFTAIDSSEVYKRVEEIRKRIMK